VLVPDKPRAASDPAASRRARCDGGEWLQSRDDSPSRTETVRFSEDDEIVMAKSPSVCIISWVGAGEGGLALRDVPSADADVDLNAECMRKPRNVSSSVACCSRICELPDAVLLSDFAVQSAATARSAPHAEGLPTRVGLSAVR